MNNSPLDNSLVFVSHAATEDGKMACRFKEWIVKSYGLKKENVFLSSSPDSIGCSDFSQAIISDKMRLATAMVVLLSRSSISKPWVLFETGSGFVRNVLISPILCNHMSVAEIPRNNPLYNLQSKDSQKPSEFSDFLSQLDSKLHRNHDIKEEEGIRKLLCGQQEREISNSTPRLPHRTSVREELFGR